MYIMSRVHSSTLPLINRCDITLVPGVNAGVELEAVSAVYTVKFVCDCLHLVKNRQNLDSIWIL